MAADCDMVISTCGTAFVGGDYAYFIGRLSLFAGCGESSMFIPTALRLSDEITGSGAMARVGRGAVRLADLLFAGQARVRPSKIYDFLYDQLIYILIMC